MRCGNRFGPEAPPTALGSHGGVTIIETMVALSIFAISLAAMGSFLTQHIRAAASNNHYTLAYAVGAEHLEALRARRYANMAEATTAIQKGDMIFTVVTTVENGEPAPNMKLINVDVSWMEPGGQRNVSLHTIYTAIRR